MSDCRKDVERETFEQTFGDQYTDFERFENGEYMDDFLQQSWIGWQASRQALEGEPVAYQYWWPESPRQVTVCKAKDLPNSGPDLIVQPLYTHPASAQAPEEIERDGINSTENLAYIDGYNDCAKEVRENARSNKQAVYSLVGHFYNQPLEGRIGIEWCCDSLDDGQELYAKQEQDHE
jgi:hypothetical protein